MFAQGPAADAASTKSLAERPKESEDGDKGPSKNALKKAAKDKEKAGTQSLLQSNYTITNSYVRCTEKVAARKAAEDKQKADAVASDVSTEDYGDLPVTGLAAPSQSAASSRNTLEEIASRFPSNKPDALTSAPGGPLVVFRAVVENAREQSAKLGFLVLGHRLNTIQAVVAASDTLSRQMVKFASRVPAQSQVLVHGIVRAPKELVKSTTIGHLEIHVIRLFVIARADAQLPIQVEDCERPLPREDTIAAGPVGGTNAGEAAAVTEAEAKREDIADGRPIVALSTRLDNRPIDLRAKLNLAIFRIKDGVVDLFSSFLRARGFVGVQTPKLLGGASESGASVFKVAYFERTAFLAQSPQLAKQMLIAAQFERVFEVGPVFRAENSNTARHLTEFIGLDLEMAFEEDYHEVVTLLEELMLHIFAGLQERFPREGELVRRTYHVEPFALPAAGKVPRLTFAEGVAMLREANATLHDPTLEIGDFDDLSTRQEKKLGELVLKRYGSDFYVLDQYPLAVRPFYTMPSTAQSRSVPGATSDDRDAPPTDPARQYSNSYDFHMRGQEILSGAQRVHSPALLEERMRAVVPPIDPRSPGIKEYVDAFRAGCPPHAGAGLGLERIVMLWLGLPNIRLASAFPRDPSRLAP